MRCPRVGIIKMIKTCSRRATRLEEERIGFFPDKSVIRPWALHSARFVRVRVLDVECFTACYRSLLGTRLKGYDTNKITDVGEKRPFFFLFFLFPLLFGEGRGRWRG